MKSLVILASLFSLSYSTLAHAEPTVLPLNSKNIVQHMVTLIGPAADRMSATVATNVFSKTPISEVCASIEVTTQAIWQARNQVLTFQLGKESEAVLEEWLAEQRSLQDLCLVKNPDIKAISSKMTSADAYLTRLYQSAK